MRLARKKRVGEDCYYHAYNRLAGRKDEHPFTDADREHGMKLLLDLSRYYLIEVISAAWMGNHWHVVCFAPCELPTLKEIEERHNRFWEPKNKLVPPTLRKPLLDAERDPEGCELAGRNMIDLSHFMGVFGQRYTIYYNKAHERRGALWADRFKSTILDQRQAVWNCVKYVELNPVRAGLVEDPADYRFSTWGWFNGSGKHMFGENFVRHLRQSMCWVDTAGWSDDEIVREFRGDLARTITSEQLEAADVAGPEAEEIVQEAVEKAKRGESMPVRFLRRTRHWVDGGIIGSKAFVRDVGCEFGDRTRIMKKRLSRGSTAEGGVLYCFKRLQTE